MFLVESLINTGGMWEGKGGGGGVQELWSYRVHEVTRLKLVVFLIHELYHKL